MLRFILFLFLLFSLSSKQASLAQTQVYENGLSLHGDIISMPIMIIKVYPFISGAVNGREGKFMFDTGLKPAIMLNDNFIQLTNKKTQGNGQVGSGQTFKTSLTDTLGEVKFSNGLAYRNLLNIRSGNYDFLQQHTTPDFLGFIGHDFFNGYVFKLDYLDKNVTFYKNTEARSLSRDYLDHEKVVAEIQFEIGKLPNVPIIDIKIDNVKILGTFDTGQNGFLQLDSISEQTLRHSGSVTTSGTDSAGDILLTVKNIKFRDKFQTSLKGLEQTSLEGTEVIRKAGNLSQANLMTIGYRFFSQYKTVWDYANKRIYILEY